MLHPVLVTWNGVTFGAFAVEILATAEAEWAWRLAHCGGVN